MMSRNKNGRGTRGRHAAATPPVKKRRRSLWTVVMWASMAVFLVALAWLGTMVYSYWHDANRYDEISQTAFTPTDDLSDEDSLANMHVDWDALSKINSEVVAWIYVPGTRISYPVCQASDNEKYLETNFDGAQGVFTGSGTIFLDSEASPDFSDDISFLFGHHMNDGSMFACVSDFADQSAFDAARDVYLLTPSCNYRFKSFALIHAVGSERLVANGFASDDEKGDYVESVEERSVVKPSEGFPSSDSIEKLLALSTCDYNQDDGRAILYCFLEDSASPKVNGSDVVGDADGYAAP